MDSPKDHSGRTRRPRRTELYLVRVWIDDKSKAQEAARDCEWPLCRGRVQRVVDGETYGFADWHELTAVLRALLTDTAPNATPANPDGHA